MSWSITLAEKGKEAAKAKLAQLAADANNHLPEAVAEMALAAIDALPDTGMHGFNTVSLATYGHFRRDGDNPGTSNFTLAAQFVADGPEA
jgi:hypothetical protein